MARRGIKDAKKSAQKLMIFLRVQFRIANLTFNFAKLVHILFNGAGSFCGFNRDSNHRFYVKLASSHGR